MNEAFLDDLADDQETARQEAGARDKRRRRRRMRSVITLVISLLLVAVLAYAAVVTVRPLLEGREEDPVEDYPGPGTGEVLVQIDEGSTGQDIGAVLAEANIVASVQAFTRAFGADPEAAGIQPGTYALREEMSGEGAVDALLDPASRAETTIAIPEGFRAAQVHERVAAEAEIPLEEVQAAAQDPEAIGLPAQAGGNPEGWYAPATYDFAPSADATTILHTMVDQTISRLDERDVPPEDRQDVLTKASIVEREVNIEEDFGRVARVIENRLMEGSETAGFLNMDSTVLYGVGRSSGIPTPAETEDADNPYNTYEHPGLPPTPIGAPGVTAIEAVLNPPEGDWQYFVTVNLETGETKFAATYAEHQENVQELREWVDANPDWNSDDQG